MILAFIIAILGIIRGLLVYGLFTYLLVHVYKIIHFIIMDVKLVLLVVAEVVGLFVFISIEYILLW